MPERNRSPRPDASWVWGVDVSVNSTDVVAVKRNSSYGFALPPSTYERPRSLDLPRTLSRKREGLLLSIRDWLTSAFPIAIFVEVPMGRHPSPSLSAAYGVTLEALAATLPEHEIYPVNISDWKKKFPGFANASKDQLVRAAAKDGFKHARQDAIDAYCIGRAGDLMLT